MPLLLVLLTLSTIHANVWVTRELDDVSYWVKNDSSEYKEIAKQNKWEIQGEKRIQILSGKSSFLEQSLDVTIWGELKDSLWMEGHLKDSDIPQVGNEYGASIQEFDEIYWKIYSPSYFLEIGDIKSQLNSVRLLSGNIISTGLHIGWYESWGHIGIERGIWKSKEIQIKNGQLGGYSFSSTQVMPNSVRVTLHGNDLVLHEDYWIEWGTGALYFYPRVLLTSTSKVQVFWQEYNMESGVENIAARTEYEYSWGKTWISVLTKKKKDSRLVAMKSKYYEKYDSNYLWNESQGEELSFYKNVANGEYSQKMISQANGEVESIFVLDTNGKYALEPESLAVFQKKYFLLGQKLNLGKSNLFAEVELQNIDSNQIEKGLAYDIEVNSSDLFWMHIQANFYGQNVQYQPLTEKRNQADFLDKWGHELYKDKAYAHQDYKIIFMSNYWIQPMLGFRTLYNSFETQSIGRAASIIKKGSISLESIFEKEYEGLKYESMQQIFIWNKGLSQSKITGQWLSNQKYWKWKYNWEELFQYQNFLYFNQDYQIEKVHTNQVDSTSSQTIVQAIKWMKPFHKSQFSWQLQKDNVPISKRNWNLIWEETHNWNWIDVSSIYSILQAYERPLIKKFDRVPDGSGDVVFDSLLQKFVENIDGGDYRNVGWERDSTVEKSASRDLALEIDLMIYGKELNSWGLLKDLTWQGLTEISTKDSLMIDWVPWLKDSYAAYSFHSFSLLKWRRKTSFLDWQIEDKKEKVGGRFQAKWNQKKQKISNRIQFVDKLYFRSILEFTKQAKDEITWNYLKFEYGPQYGFEPFWVYPFLGGKIGSQKTKSLRQKKYGLEFGIRVPKHFLQFKYTNIQQDNSLTALVYSLYEGFERGESQLWELEYSWKWNSKAHVDFTTRIKTHADAIDVSSSLLGRVEF